MAITFGSRWQYVGPNPGTGGVHTVVWVEPEEIVTWEFHGGSRCGHSWLGSRSDFLKMFKRL